MLCFYFVAQCNDCHANMSEFRSFVQIVCVCFTCISSFPLEVMSSAFVLPFAAVLIVEAVVFVFCLHHETRRCVGYCFFVLECCCIIALLLMGYF